MDDVKKKALGGIQSMLEDRMASRMKPKAVSVEVDVEKKPEGEEAEGAPEGDKPEGMLEGKDLSGLTPEEQEQLQMLLAKLEC